MSNNELKETCFNDSVLVTFTSNGAKGDLTAKGDNCQ